MRELQKEIIAYEHVLPEIDPKKEIRRSIDFLKDYYPGALNKRYGVQEEQEALGLVQEIAKARGCLKRGEELDYEKAAGLIFDDFRSGKLGRITLEWAEQEL